MEELCLSLGRREGESRQRRRGRFREDPRVEHRVPDVRHAGKAPVDAVGKLLRVVLLLRGQQIALPDGVDGRVGVLPVIRHPRDVDERDRDFLHGPGRACHQVVQPHVMVEVQGLRVVEHRERLLRAFDPVGVSPFIWAEHHSRKFC